MTERLIVGRSAERMMNSPAHSQAVRSLMDSPTPGSSDDDDSSTSSCDMNYNLCPTDEKSTMHQPLHAHILNGRAIQFDDNRQILQRDQNRYNRTDLKKRQSTENRSSTSGHKPSKESLQQTPHSVSKAMLMNDLPTLVRSSGPSPSGFRSSLDDIIDDTIRHSTKTPSTAVTAVTQDLTVHNTPLILDSDSSSNFPSSSHTKESHGVFGPTSSNPNSALVLTSDEERHIRELQNNKLKHFFPNVQLPRPRLLPFSPVLNQGIPVQQQQQQQQQQRQHVENSMTAAKFAKNAPKAGYLSKLGSSVAEYKKRFFVLKPTTCLYYFLSPNDEEPRGCIDLEGFVDPTDSSGIGGLQVNSLGTLPDGRFRFECVIPVERNDRDSPNSRKILLESRNEEVGREWMEALKTERLSYAKGQHQLLQDQIQVLEKELETMEKNLDNLKLVEQDLEGAMEDSKKWQMRVEKMDDAMRTLKRFMASDSNKSLNESIDTSGDDNTGVLSLSKEEHDLDAINLPDSQFANLVNVCRGVKENLRLTSNETDIALDDLKNSNGKLKTVEEKMAKAEKYICKLWEENCSARESIKQRKNEKKILISEVKSLMKKTSSQENEIKRLKLENEQMQKQLGESAVHSRSGQITTASSNTIKKIRQLTPLEEKLLFDLEDFVNSSLVEHEYLLDDIKDSPDPISHDNVEDSGQSLLQTCKKSNVSVDVTDTSRYPHRDYEARDGDSSEELQEEVDEKDEGGKSPKRSFSPLMPKQLPLVENKVKPSNNISLMDQAVLDEEKNARLAEILRSVSSQALKSTEAKNPSNCQELPNVSIDNKGSDCLQESRKHPLDQWDDNSVTSASQPSLKSIPSVNGRATSKLVSNTMVQSTHNGEENSSGRVYSLTFYSSKIGLQFQNVPTDLKNSGILNNAINVDEHGTTIASDQAETEAELALVKTLSQDTDSSQQVTPAQTRYLNLRPKHQVLVCGFNGFDAGANNNRKPSLGARLVGYNGVSLEHGPWAFDAVAKVIREQGRPLTLTFRDDNLNREQQAILDKAVKDVLQFSRQSVKQARIPVAINTNIRLSNGSLRNLSRESLNIDDNTTLSDYSRYSDNWKSFSEAGSPSMSSSNLLSKLVPGLSRKEKKKKDVHYTPEYFHRSTETLESTPRHKEFKSNLL